MENISEIINYKDQKGKMLYTFLIHSCDLSQVKSYFVGLFDKIQTINDQYKRKIATERIKSFDKYWEDYKLNSQINSVFLVSATNLIVRFDLNKAHVKTLLDFKIPTSQYFCDDCYNIEYIKKIISEDELINVCMIDNNVAQIIQLDSVKNRLVTQTDLASAFDKYNCEIYWGLSSQLASFIKKYPNKKIINEKILKSEIWNRIIYNRNLLAQEKLNNEVLIQITNTEKSDLFIFGRQNVGNQILNYGVKKLFITSKLYNNMIQKVEPQYLNFEIIVVNKNTDGDYADTLIKNFDGIVGIKYY